MASNWQTGLYRCRVTDHDLTQSKKGTPQLWLQLTPLQKLNTDGTREEYSTENFVSMWLPLTTKAAVWVGDSIKALGFTGKISGLAKNGSETLIGHEAEFYCKQREDSDFPNWSVSTPRTPSKPAVELNNEQLMAIDSIFGGETAAADAPAAPSSSSDDNPF